MIYTNPRLEKKNTVLSYYWDLVQSDQYPILLCWSNTISSAASPIRFLWSNMMRVVTHIADHLALVIISQRKSFTCFSFYVTVYVDKYWMIIFQYLFRVLHRRVVLLSCLVEQTGHGHCLGEVVSRHGLPLPGLCREVTDFSSDRSERLTGSITWYRVITRLI
jgi:hypothetical protein